MKLLWLFCLRNKSFLGATAVARPNRRMLHCANVHYSSPCFRYNCCTRPLERAVVQPSRLLMVLSLLLAGLHLRAADVSYYRDIRPIIQRQCQGCHQPSVKSSNLDLTTYEGFQSGGKRGPAAKVV